MAMDNDNPKSQQDKERPFNWNKLRLTFDYINKGPNTEAQAEAHDRRQREIAEDFEANGIDNPAKSEEGIDGFIKRREIAKAKKLPSDGKTQDWILPLDNSELRVRFEK